MAVVDKVKANCCQLKNDKIPVVMPFYWGYGVRSIFPRPPAQENMKLLPVTKEIVNIHMFYILNPQYVFCP